MSVDSRNFEIEVFELLNDYLNNSLLLNDLKSEIIKLSGKYSDLEKNRSKTKDKNEIIEYTKALSKFDFINALYEIEKDKENQQKLNNELKNDYIYDSEVMFGKHTKDIINIIYNTPGIQHKELANELKINTDTLTKYISSIYDRNVVTKVKSSKFVFYYLTDKGDKFYKDVVCQSSSYDGSYNKIMTINDIRKIFNIKDKSNNFNNIEINYNFIDENKKENVCQK